MSDDLKLLVKRINVRIRAEDPTVVEAAVKLTEQYPQEPDAWKTLAQAYLSDDHYPEAIAALTRAIELDPQRILLFFQRGENELSLENYQRAIADFSQALVLCDRQNADWCRRDLHFLRAEALVLSGKTSEALSDLACVPDDYVNWAAEVPSKAELLALCADAVSPGNDGRYQGPADPSDESPVSLDECAHLLIDDRSVLGESPNEDEVSIAQKLGAEGLAKADATILKWVPQRWAKVARILLEAIEADDLDVTDTLARVYLRRLIALVEAGKIEPAGNLWRPRFSEVRLPENEESP